jgi:hypothetical protein
MNNAGTGDGSFYVLVLDQARGLLLKLGARQALAEADALLGRLTALSS